MSLFSELKRRNVIRVAVAYLAAAWLITEVAGTVLPAFGYGDSELRIIIILLVIAIVPVLVFSWVFEITPEGLKREVDVNQEQSITRFTGKKIDRIIIVLLALGLVYFAFDKFILDPAEDDQIAASAHQEGRAEAWIESFGDRSIAVLPFDNKSNDPNDDYLSAGFADELRSLLSRVPNVRVAGPASSAHFKDKSESISEIAKTLNVVHILQGTVWRIGKQLKITANLTETQSDTILWSDSFDSDFEDILRVQDEISWHIFQALDSELNFGGHGRANTGTEIAVDPDAYDLYLKGRNLLLIGGIGNYKQAIVYLYQATEIDPEFARAWSSLAVARASFASMDRGIHRKRGIFEGLLAQAVNAAQRALELDNTLAEAHAVLGDLAQMRNEWPDAERNYLHAVNSEPGNSIMLRWYGNHLATLGRTVEGMEYVEMSYRLDPLNVGNLISLSGHYLTIGNYEEALEFGGLVVQAGIDGGYRRQALASFYLGRTEQALEFARRYDKEYESILKSYLEAWMDKDQRPAFIETIDKQEMPSSVIDLWFMISAYANFGDMDKAFHMATEAHRSGTFSGMDWVILWWPGMEAFRQDDRFGKLADDLGMLDYWRKFGWPDSCRPVEQSVACN